LDLLTARSGLITPFEFASGLFLQVLVNRFSMKRNKTSNGVRLEIKFDQDTPAIWSRQAKNDIRMLLPNFEEKAAKYQKILDDFLIYNKSNKTETFLFNEKNFCFRYASAGTLPILRMDKTDYYCLFYRDIFPIGWNIANGACDTFQELLDPIVALERELREELIIVDLKKGKRYVFNWDAGKPFDMPEFGMARKLWQAQFSNIGFQNFDEIEIPLKWVDGPDSVTVKYARNPLKRVTGCFLNINGYDFGIEIDKITKINVDKDITILDGEVLSGQLLNRIIGLFPVEELNQSKIENEKHFVPDKFFYNGALYQGKKLKSIVNGKFLPHVFNLRDETDILYYKNAKYKYDLCPVTRRIILRYMTTHKPRVKRKSQAKKTLRKPKFDVFISFHSKDKHIARKVYEFLQSKANMQIFFSEENYDADYSRIIDEALESAKNLIVIGSKPDYLNENYPCYEWRAFHHMILNGRKENANLVSFISFHKKKLPLRLSLYQAISFEKNTMEPSLSDLAKYLS
jgi:hypothetical protein